MIAILQHNSNATRFKPDYFSNDTLAPTGGSGALLVQMFRYRWSWIEAPNTVSRPSWRTENRYPLSPFQLWDKWSDPALLVGVSFGPRTDYGLIDIDARSPYHGQLRAVTDALEDIGINKTVLVRSSHTGGYHLYYFLPEPVSTFELACVVRWALHRAGLEIKDGHLEQFPNTKAYDAQYKSHRLPLQPDSGSALVDENSFPCSDRITRFHELAQATAQAQDLDTLLEAMPGAKSWWKAKQRRTAKVEASLAAWRRDLETAQLQGWTGPGQTNELLGKIATYGRVFLGYDGQKLAGYIQRTAQDCPGFTRWCGHIQQIARKAWDWARSAMHRYWSLGTRKTEEPPDVNRNSVKSLQARLRIADAVDKLTAQGALPATITERAIAIRGEAKCSPSTLYKNLSLWHPDHTGEKGCNSPAGKADSDLAAVDSDTAESLSALPLKAITHLVPNEGLGRVDNAAKHSSPCPVAAPLFQPSSPLPVSTAQPDPNLKRFVITLRNRYAAAQWSGNGRQMASVKDELSGLGLSPDLVLSPSWDGRFG